MRLTAVTWRDLANPLAGGAEILLDRVLLGLAERGHSVSLVCGGPVSDHEYEVVNAGGTYSQYLKAPFICLARYRQSDVIIDCENGLPFFSPLWRRRPSVCLVHHVHTDQWGDRFPAPVAALCSAIESRVMPAVYRNQVFVAISESTAESLRSIGVPADHIHVIEPGIDVLSLPKAERSAEPLFISLNRLVPHKRIGLLLDAWEIASQQLPGRLVIAGDGPELAAVRKRASDIPRVEVLGRISEDAKQRLLAKAWCLVTSAHHEGWGISIMEAAAAGTPSLAVDVPGVRDAILDGSTGLLVRGDESELPSVLAEAMVALANDEPLREQLGASAHQRATRFGWDRTIDQWQAVLEEVAEQNVRPLPTMFRMASRALPLYSTTAASTSTGTTASPRKDFVGEIRRSINLLKGFRTQYDDPEGFYTLLAEDTVSLVNDYQSVSGSRVVDVGGGPGYFAAAFRRSGAESVFVEPFWGEMGERGRGLGYGIIGDGLELPFADGTFDIAHSSNVIEHVVDPESFFDETLRILRPGGTLFLAFTNWFSPFGGHETSPWHYLGGERAVKHYERTHGELPKNQFGTSLFRLDISDLLSWARRREDADLIDTFPRYYPQWTKRIVAIPGVREVVTWNLVIVMRRR